MRPCILINSPNYLIDSKRFGFLLAEVLKENNKSEPTSNRKQVRIILTVAAPLLTVSQVIFQSIELATSKPRAKEGEHAVRQVRCFLHAHFFEYSLRTDENYIHGIVINELTIFVCPDAFKLYCMI